MRRDRLLDYLPVFVLLALIAGCKKNVFEPSLEGTWIEISDTASQAPTGCTLTINQDQGEVTLCGFKFVQPNNVVTLTTKRKARLFIKDGQMFYRQKKADILWIAPIAKEDEYFIDYDFDNGFLWIIGDDSDTKTSAIGKGKLFKRP